jgi:hypothetical protein
LTKPKKRWALPLTLDIQQFWAWLTPLRIAVRIEFKSQVEMKGDALIGRNPQPVNAYATDTSAAAFESIWASVIETGLADLSTKMKVKIKAPSEPRR